MNGGVSFEAAYGAVVRSSVRSEFGGGVPAWTYVVLGALLNVTLILNGTNVSPADIACVLLIAVLAWHGELRVPISIAISFFVLSFAVLLVSGFVTSIRFAVEPSATSLALAYLKMVTVYLYFVVGYSIAHCGLFFRLYRAYALAAALIASVGVVATLFGPFAPMSWMYSYFRFQGFMSDPNYYAVTAVAALPYFFWGLYRRGFGLVGLVLLILGVLLSGSKTGVVALIATLVSLVCLRAICGRRDDLGRLPYRVLSALSGLLLIWLATGNRLRENFASLPSLERILGLFVNFEDAAISDGSGRIGTWDDSIEIWASAPVTGIGIGSYLDVAGRVVGGASLAHNTYLQLLVEWGLIPAIVLFGFIIYQVWREIRLVHGGLLRVSNSVSPVLLSFLVGSLGLSLNNARMFWLLLGVLMLVVGRARGHDRLESSSRLRQV